MVDMNLVKKIKEDCIKDRIPILLDESLSYINGYIKNNDVKSILEIGTAVGYSSIMMVIINPNVKITSIERDQERYMQAVKNVKSLGLDDRITLIYNDALDVSIEDKFDLIFIDAAKSQSIKFFEKFEYNLNDKGTIITDNINFHGFVKDKDKIESRDLKGLVNKIENYIEFLKSNKKYETEFLDIGDGLSVSCKL